MPAPRNTFIRYQIINQCLSQEDLSRLALAAQTFRDYIDVPFFDSINGSVQKLQTALTQYQKQSIHKDIFHFEKTSFPNSTNYLDALVDAILQTQPVSITYKKFNQSHTITYTIHPYILKEYQNRWYILGLDDKRKKPMVLSLDRFELMETTNIPYIPPVDSDIKPFFKNTIGVSYTGKVRKVVLWFSSTQAPYIKTKHIHETQTIISDNENGLVISLNVLINFELQSLILSYGTQVKVLAPQTLIEKISQEIETMQKLYLPNLP